MDEKESNIGLPDTHSLYSFPDEIPLLIGNPCVLIPKLSYRPPFQMLLCPWLSVGNNLFQMTLLDMFSALYC